MKVKLLYRRKAEIMKIYGLQKMTLLDFPGKVACTVFTGGCDFRCPYCHNYELVDGSAPALMDEEEFLQFLSKRKGLLDGVAITGGEPCIQKDLPGLMRRIRETGFAVKLDTNGNHPEMLQRILEEKLADYVAMDIKNAPEKYALTIGLQIFNIESVRQSAEMLLKGETDYEFRTTVVDELHCDRDFEGIGQWIQGAKKYFLQPFTDRDTVPFGNFHAPSIDKMQRWEQIMKRYVKEVNIRGET